MEGTNRSEPDSERCGASGKKAEKLGVEYEFNYLGATGITHKTVGNYLIDKLKASKP